MNDFFISVQSITMAYQVRELLMKNGIPCRIERKDATRAQGGCGYQVAVGRRDLARTTELLARHHINFNA